MDHAMMYKIRVDGHLSPHWSEWFCHSGKKPDVELTYLANGETVIRGALPDQAALQRVLTKICDLGLSLTSIVAVKKELNGDPLKGAALKDLQSSV